MSNPGSLPDPPLWIFRLLRRYCPPQLLEEIQGDLMQRFAHDCASLGEAKARRKLVWNAVRFFRPGILLRNPKSLSFNHPSMIRNYLRVGVRHLFRHRVFTAINIFGMTVGLSAFVLIAQYIDYELAFDRFHTNADQVVRMMYEKRKNGEVVHASSGTFFGAGDFAQQNFPEVRKVMRFYKWPAHTGVVLRTDGRIYNEKNYFFADSTFFELFTSLLVQGEPATCLDDHHSVVLSERASLRIFGTTDVLGKQFDRLDIKDYVLTVTGVFRDLPENSHFDADVIIPFDADWRSDKKDHWKFPSHWTYLLLDPGTDARSFEAKLNQAIQDEHGDIAEVKEAFVPVQRLTDIHFEGHASDEIKANGNEVTVYALGIAALAILIISWINYINLESARFLTRIREVGVRRVIGSSTRDLLVQFFIQYMILSLPVVVLAVGLIYFVQPLYSQITGVTLGLPSLESPVWVAATAALMAGMLITGLFPVLTLTRLNPILSLKGKLSSGGNLMSRRLLLTIQFSVSLVLMALLFVVTDQLTFMRENDQWSGLDRVLTFPNPTTYTRLEDSLRKEKFASFRNELLSHSTISDVTASSAIPGEEVGFTYENFTKRELTSPDDGIAYKVIFGDDSFIPVYNIKLLAGRNYSNDNAEDLNNNTIVLNESGVRALGFPSAQAALDQEIYFMVTFDWKKYRIVGVVEDYHHESVKEKVNPTILYFNLRTYQMAFYSVRIDDRARVTDAVASVEDARKKVWPEKSFEYTFMDQRFDQQYKAEIRLTAIFRLFSGVAILLACLGILGITLFESHARLKEIGIRKVLGASIINLIHLLTQSYVRIALIAGMIAAPLIFLAGQRWLNDYPVRIHLNIFFFVIPLAFLLTLVALSSVYQTYRAAAANPVDQLKHE